MVRCRICRKNVERKVVPSIGKPYNSVGHQFEHLVMGNIKVCTACYRILSKDSEYLDPDANQTFCELCNQGDQKHEIIYSGRVYCICDACRTDALESPKACCEKFDEINGTLEKRRQKEMKRLKSKDRVKFALKEIRQEQLEDNEDDQPSGFNPFEILDSSNV